MRLFFFVVEASVLRITRQADYGIVLLTHLAEQKAGTVRNARKLASETRLPLPTVSKILKVLASKDLLASHQGANGGYELARQSDEISVADVVRALDGPVGITDCIEDARGSCEHTHYCPISSNWKIINDAIVGVLEDITLLEMIRPMAEDPVQETVLLSNSSP